MKKLIPILLLLLLCFSFSGCARNAVAPDPTENAAELDPDAFYYTPEDVALFLHTYDRLPANYITKAEAKDLGWVASEKNLWDVAPGYCIGGDYFGNYEELLPDGDYHECDVNYQGGARNAERLIYSSDGAIYYTADHYASFTRLY